MLHGRNAEAGSYSRFRCPTLEAVLVPGKVMLVASSTLPVPRLDAGVGVCEAIPALLHEEARPVLAPIPCRGGLPCIGGAKFCWLQAGSWGDSLLLPHKCTGLCINKSRCQLTRCDMNGPGNVSLSCIDWHTCDWCACFVSGIRDTTFTHSCMVKQLTVAVMYRCCITGTNTQNSSQELCLLSGILTPAA